MIPGTVLFTRSQRKGLMESAAALIIGAVLLVLAGFWVLLPVIMYQEMKSLGKRIDRTNELLGRVDNRMGVSLPLLEKIAKNTDAPTPPPPKQQPPPPTQPWGTSCLACGQEFEFDPKDAGREVECPSCRSTTVLR